MDKTNPRLSGNYCAFYDLYKDYDKTYDEGELLDEIRGIFKAKLLPLGETENQLCEYVALGVWMLKLGLAIQNNFVQYSGFKMPDLFPEGELAKGLAKLGINNYWPLYCDYTKKIEAECGKALNELQKIQAARGMVHAPRSPSASRSKRGRVRSNK